MPSQLVSSTENNFTKGLITEATGLNFPENAATDASNCEFTLVGDVIRREGYNLETNGQFYSTGISSLIFKAQTTFVWNNPGGQSNKTIFVRQIGEQLYFYDVSASTKTSPLSSNMLIPQILGLSNFVASNSVGDYTLECSFAEGNGYLFVYQSTLQPFYLTYTNGIITGTPVPIQIRDFTGAVDNLPVNNRPSALSDAHWYNLQNQGWTQGNAWQAASGSNYTTGSVGSFSFTCQTGITGVTGGQSVVLYYTGSPFGFSIPTGSAVASGTVTSYNSGTGGMVLNITANLVGATGFTLNSWSIVPNSSGNISTFFTAASVYPSNADVWWYFKDSTGAFNPASTLNNITLATGNAPQGHFILDAFVQQRSQYVSTISPISTSKRPSTGTWWQGRVWYAGVNDSAAATGNTPFYSWTGNIYFSTIVQSVMDFGVCYQTNDPTSENLNGFLPSDGGVITIHETGTIHKLFPIANGLLVFANNGVWFITGSQGIGFEANDYTVTKISSIKTLSSKSFVDVLGLPFFWNEEGIYQVMPSGQSGGLTVNPITVGTILTFYNQIPLQSIKYARGDYDPINYIIQWSFRSTPETGVSDRYDMDTILNYNTYNKAFFPYDISPFETGATKGPYISGVRYVTYPVITSTTPLPGFKYPFHIEFSTPSPAASYSFVEENDPTYVDWGYLGGVNFKSTFTTGYKVHGKGLFKFSVPYVSVFNRTEEDYLAYYIQGVWDYAIKSDSNRWTTNQFVEILDSNSNMVARRHKIRGRGLTLQIRFTSVDGEPFDFMGWAIYEQISTGV